MRRVGGVGIARQAAKTSDDKKPTQETQRRHWSRGSWSHDSHKAVSRKNLEVVRFRHQAEQKKGSVTKIMFRLGASRDPWGGCWILPCCYFNRTTALFSPRRPMLPPRAPCAPDPSGFDNNTIHYTATQRQRTAFFVLDDLDRSRSKFVSALFVVRMPQPVKLGSSDGSLLSRSVKINQHRAVYRCRAKILALAIG